MSTTTLFRRLFVAIALLASPAFGGFAPSASAQTAQAGPIAFRNDSGRAIRLTNIVYTDASGTERRLEGGYDLKAGAYTYLLVGDDKIVGKKFVCDVATDDGATNWIWNAAGLDANGNVILQFTEGNFASHLKTLGKTPPVVRASNFTPRADGPSEEQVKKGLVKILGAAVANAVAQEQPDGFFEALIVEAARKARDEVIESAIGDLFPQLSATEKAGTRRVIALSLDGRLTVDRFNAETAREQIIELLRREDREFGRAAEVADFIGQVHRSRR